MIPNRSLIAIGKPFIIISATIQIILEILRILEYFNTKKSFRYSDFASIKESLGWRSVMNVAKN